MNSDTAEKGAKSATYNLGMTNEEMSDSFVGIVNLYSRIVPSHMNINKIVDALKRGVAMASSIEISKS